MKMKTLHFAPAQFFCRNLSGILALILILAGIESAQAQVFPNLGGQRAGISAMTFLKNDVSPRSVAMGGANMALQGDGYAMSTNPAGGVATEFPSLALSTRVLPANILQTYLGAIIPTKNRSAWMVSMNYFSTGTQKRRTEFQPFGDGTVYSSNAWKVGAGYSKSLSKMFSFGLNVNFVREELAQYAVNAASVDMGFLYQTDWKNLSFAVGLQHFGVNSTLSGSDLPTNYNRAQGVKTESYGAPTLFSMGVSMIPLKIEAHQLVASLQLNHPNDNSENIRIGTEYSYDSLIFVRVGYKFNVIGESVSMGAGVRTRIGAVPLMVEFTTLPTRYLGWQYVVGLRVGFQKVRQ